MFPDYQGLGIGLRFQTTIADFYVKQGYRFYTVTSHPAIINGLKPIKEWKLTRIGRIGSRSETGIMHNKNNKSTSSNRITTSWQYVL